MGIEYIIRCKLKPGIDHSDAIERLNNPTHSNGWSAFTASIQDDGIYFCDNCWSDAATVAFRKLVDHALAYSQSVTIEEP